MDSDGNQQVKQSANKNIFTMTKQQKNAQHLKYISLVTLTVQNALVGLSMRYARTRSGDMFLSSTAVVMSEVVKLLTCLCLVFIEEGNFPKFIHTLNTTIIKQPLDTLKVCVPSLVYIIQNNLLYVSASNLDAATYQVGNYLITWLLNNYRNNFLFDGKSIDANFISEERPMNI
ncbi:UDP-galactose translocator-like [Belonocnema kinseyi]|uniref:UDP-galactose translocator-like n=1 Tax=Belonocnema kinseyi TaxID=2817044 RepID=UPI00143CC228|nr:UDP-galactose translocator-like [Belonocnema kinseyi]